MLGHIRYKIIDTNNGWKIEYFTKFRDEKQTFKSLVTKNELLWKFKDENDIYPILFY